jgi:D-alanyl-D-alanine carboxypeptidase (penicillin-binding protein 5/6)
MANTHYASVHGLETGDAPSTLTTAWDQATLARQLIRFPEALRLSNTVSTVIRGGQRIRTTNKLLRRFPGIDGLKTGTTARAGYCLVTTSERNGWRLISEVLGAAEGWRRFGESANLLYEAFLEWQRVQVVSKGQVLGEDLTVRDGARDSVDLLAGEDLEVLIPAKQRGALRVHVSAPPSTRAPVVEGWTLGQVEVLLGDSLLTRCPAIAAISVPRVSPFNRGESMTED